MGAMAYSLIQQHISECATNYRRLTGWIIATLLTVLGATVIILVSIVLHASKLS